MGPYEWSKMHNHLEKSQITEDPIVNTVISKFIARSAQGMEKYGMSMAENNNLKVEWIEDTQEELMDAILYLQKLKEEMING